MDATTVSTATEFAVTRAVVNGPKDSLPDWNAVDWRQVEADVQRLRQRIFAASKAGDRKKVRQFRLPR